KREITFLLSLSEGQAREDSGDFRLGKANLVAMVRSDERMHISDLRSRHLSCDPRSRPRPVKSIDEKKPRAVENATPGALATSWSLPEMRNSVCATYRAGRAFDAGQNSARVFNRESS